MLRHRHLASYIISSVEFLGCEADEATLVCVPPYHIAGVAAVLTAARGRRTVYLPRSTPPIGCAWRPRNRSPTPWSCRPCWAAFSTRARGSGRDAAGAAPLSYGGGRMPLEWSSGRCGTLPQVDFVNAYGLTETSSTIAMLDARRPPRGVRLDRRGGAGAGWARSGGRCRRWRSRSAGRGEVLGPGQSGEIWVRGEQVGRRVPRDEPCSRRGLVRHQRRRLVRRRGLLVRRGRLDDVIVRGARTSRRGRSRTAAAHPAVADVAVFGIPDAEWGEPVAAVVVLQPGSGPASGRRMRMRMRMRCPRPCCRSGCGPACARPRRRRCRVPRRVAVLADGQAPAPRAARRAVGPVAPFVSRFSTERRHRRRGLRGTCQSSRSLGRRPPGQRLHVEDEQVGELGAPVLEVLVPQRRFALVAQRRRDVVTRAAGQLGPDPPQLRPVVANPLLAQQRGGGFAVEVLEPPELGGVLGLHGVDRRTRAPCRRRRSRPALRRWPPGTRRTQDAVVHRGQVAPALLIAQSHPVSIPAPAGPATPGYSSAAKRSQADWRVMPSASPTWAQVAPSVPSPAGPTRGGSPLPEHGPAPRWEGRRAPPPRSRRGPRA